MKEHELELDVSISIPILTVIFYMTIISSLSALNSFNNIKYIPINELGLTIGFVIFNLMMSLFKSK
ncbi:hypothetical protein KW95_04505 [Clostridioides difficile]|nr:hypothetical protein KW95_04505 [Clostridioides difficile]